MVNAYGENRTVGFYYVRRSSECVQLCSFNIHFDKRRLYIGQQLVKGKRLHSDVSVLCDT